MSTMQTIALLLALSVAPDPSPPPIYYSRWLEGVDALLTPEEKQLFTSLQDDGGREAFIRRFWAARDPQPAVPGNSAREDWDRHLRLAARRFSDSDDPRYETLRLLGEPSHLYRIECRFYDDHLLLQPIEIWRYSPSVDAADPLEDTLVIFVSEGPKYRVWSRHDDPFEMVAERPRPWRWRGSMLESLKRLYRSVPHRGAVFKHCLEQNEEPFAALDKAVPTARTLEEMRALAKLPVAAGWTEELTAAASTRIRSIPGDLELAFPGLRNGQPVLEARLRLDRSALLGQRTRAQVELSSEVVRDGEIRDRTTWSLVLDVDSTTASIPFGFFHGVENESTHLLVRLAEPETGRHYLSVVALEPPTSGPGLPEGHELPPPYHLLGAGGLDFVLAAHRLEILELDDGPKVRRLDVRAAAHGPRLAAVEWHLEGEVVAVSQSAPYTAVVELGRLPVRQWLEAVAVDRDGKPLVRDRVLLNGGPHRLALRLVEPQPGESYRDRAPVRALVDHPGDTAVERMEFFVNDRLAASRSQAPFEAEVALGGALAVVRGVVTLEDGRAAEDAVIVNAPDFSEQVDVDLVELFVSVRDRRGRPVHDLEAGDFEVREEGVRQNVKRFQRVEKLPIHVLLAVDSSESMKGRMRLARKVAEEFLRRVVSPKDQAALLAFNHLPQMLGDFAHDGDSLAEQVAALEAEGGTALYDSVIYSLFQFGGLKGKRALVLVSDGADEHSRFGVEEAIEFAKRRGIAVYTIGAGFSPDLDRRSLGGVKLLRDLAKTTGGLVFFVDTNKDLARALARIEEDLRSQYLLAYAPPEGQRGVFREVEVEVLRPGLEARTIRGYFAGGF